jgi:type I restriction enzyme S subunit
LVRLRDLGEWAGGNTPPKANATYWTNGTVPWVSPKDMKVDEIISSEDHITEAALNEGRVSLVPEGSILIVTRSGILAHTLPVALTKLPVTINQDLKALTPKPGVLPKYVAHAVRGASRRILKECSKHGTTVASIETNALLDFEIPLVNLDEQRRIVAEIEKQFPNLRRVKADLKRYKATVLKAAVEGRLVPTEAELARREGRSFETGSQLLQRVAATITQPTRAKKFARLALENAGQESPDLPEGWARASIGALASLVEYGSSAKSSESIIGVPVLRMGNIVDGELDFAELKFLANHHEEFPRLLLQVGDLLFNRTNSHELVGKTAVYKGKPPKCSFASYLIRVRLVGGCVPEFVAAYINSVYGRKWVKAVVTQQVGQANVNGTKLQNLQVPLPPVAEQTRIVQEVERHISVIGHCERIVDSLVRRAATQRSALLSRAFVMPA